MATTQQAIPTLARPKQTAEFFSISIMTLHRWSKKQGFPAPMKMGQVVLYSAPAITAWLAGEAQ